MEALDSKVQVHNFHCMHFLVFEIFSLLYNLIYSLHITLKYNNVTIVKELSLIHKHIYLKSQRLVYIMGAKGTLPKFLDDLL